MTQRFGIVLESQCSENEGDQEDEDEEDQFEIGHNRYLPHGRGGRRGEYNQRFGHVRASLTAPNEPLGGNWDDGHSISLPQRAQT